MVLPPDGFPPASPQRGGEERSARDGFEGCLPIGAARRGKLAAITFCRFKQIHKFYFAECICNSPPITHAGHGLLIHHFKITYG